MMQLPSNQHQPNNDQDSPVQLSEEGLVSAPPPPPTTTCWDGKRVLLISHRPTALMQQLAATLVEAGAHVTIACRHRQDARYAVKKILTQQHNRDTSLLASASSPLNMASLASVQDFAATLDSSAEALDLLVVDTCDLYAAGMKDRRWYTKQGVAGTAQTGFVGRAVLLHLLQRKLADSGTAVLLTASATHRLAALDDLHTILTSWGRSTLAATQAALLAYVRRLALQLHGQGVTAAAVDLSVLSEQPLKGSMLRKLPVLRQALHMLLPSAHDASRLLTDVAAHILASNTSSGSPAASSMGAQQGSASGDSNTAHTASGPALPSVFAGDSSATLPSEPMSASTESVVASQDSSSMHSAHPTATAPAGPLAATSSSNEHGNKATAQDATTQMNLDQAAAFDMGGAFSMSAATRTLGSLDPQHVSGSSAGAGASTADEGAAGAAGHLAAQQAPGSVGIKPFSYMSRGLLASPLITAVDLSGSTTWISRALHALTTPLYDIFSSALVSTASLADWPVRALLLGPLSQLQALVPGVVGVPAEWVEVTPSGAVLDEKLGWRLWHVVDGYASSMVVQEK